MDSTAEASNPAETAERSAAQPDIHPDDFIFQYHLTSSWCTERQQAVDFYIMDGERSANQLSELIRKHYGETAGKLSILEFASGYGCVSRHLKNFADYRVVSCDIHPQAVQFLREKIEVECILSNSDPEKLAAGEQFDVVFALSFFSHMPPATWGKWLRKLFTVVSDGGLLIFTSHGRNGWKAVNKPMLETEGFWFSPISEQKDIPTEEYGTMIVSPYYVFEQLKQAEIASPIFFQEALWWGTQDTYIVRKPHLDDRPAHKRPPPPEPMAAPIEPQAEPIRWREQEDALRARIGTLEAEVGTLRSSRSWRITAPLRTIGRLVK